MNNYDRTVTHINNPSNTNVKAKNCSVKPKQTEDSLTLKPTNTELIRD